jgi:hypothetical protein
MKKYHLATLSRQVYLVLSGGNTFRMKKMSQKGFKGISKKVTNFVSREKNLPRK